MSKFLVLVLGVALFSLTGCGPKEEKSEFSPESVDMMAENNTTSNVTIVESNTTVAAPATAGKGAANVTASGQTSSSSAEFKVSGEEIQTVLTKLGLYKGSIDGKLGPKTKEAIEWFQTKNGLNSDGKVGPKTWAKMQEAVVALSAPVASSVAPSKDKKSKKTKKAKKVKKTEETGANSSNLAGH